MQRVALYYFELNTSNLSCMSPMREENLLVEAVDYRQERVGKRGRGGERGFLVYMYMIWQIMHLVLYYYQI